MSKVSISYKVKILIFLSWNIFHFDHFQTNLKRLNLKTEGIKYSGPRIKRHFRDWRNMYVTSQTPLYKR